MTSFPARSIYTNTVRRHKTYELGKPALKILKEYIWVFFVSMLPIVELRLAVPIGVGMDLPLIPTLLVSIVGNTLPVPFIIFFAQRVLERFAKLPKIGHIFQKIIDKATEKSKTFGKYELLALYTFVAIPLPGTGAWTGSLIAAILQLNWRKAMPAIFAGIVTAGVIMSLASAGLFGALGYIFGFG